MFCGNVLLLYLKNNYSAAILYLVCLFDIAVSGLGVLGQELVQLVPWNLPGPLNRPVFPCMLWPLGGEVLIAGL